MKQNPLVRKMFTIPLQQLDIPIVLSAASISNTGGVKLVEIVTRVCSSSGIFCIYLHVKLKSVFYFVNELPGI